MNTRSSDVAVIATTILSILLLSPVGMRMFPPVADRIINGPNTPAEFVVPERSAPSDQLALRAEFPEAFNDLPEALETPAPDEKDTVIKTPSGVTFTKTTLAEAKKSAKWGEDIAYNPSDRSRHWPEGVTVAFWRGDELVYGIRTGNTSRSSAEEPKPGSTVWLLTPPGVKAPTPTSAPSPNEAR